MRLMLFSCLWHGGIRRGERADRAPNTQTLELLKEEIVPPIYSEEERIR
jgi:hypothetical protein